MIADPPAALTERLASIGGVASVTFHNGGLWVDAPLLDVEAMADAMAGLGIRLATITAVPQFVKGETTIIYHFIAEFDNRQFQDANPQRGAHLAGRAAARGRLGGAGDQGFVRGRFSRPSESRYRC